MTRILRIGTDFHRDLSLNWRHPRFFKGTPDVSQEISELQKITGDKRLLD